LFHVAVDAGGVFDAVDSRPIKNEFGVKMNGHSSTKGEPSSGVNNYRRAPNDKLNGSDLVADEANSSEHSYKTSKRLLPETIEAQSSAYQGQIENNPFQTSDDIAFKRYDLGVGNVQDFERITSERNVSRRANSSYKVPREDFGHTMDSINSSNDPRRVEDNRPLLKPKPEFYPGTTAPRSNGQTRHLSKTLYRSDPDGEPNKLRGVTSLEHSSSKRPSDRRMDMMTSGVRHAEARSRPGPDAQMYGTPRRPPSSSSEREANVRDGNQTFLQPAPPVRQTQLPKSRIPMSQSQRMYSCTRYIYEYSLNNVLTEFLMCCDTAIFINIFFKHLD